ncbi:antitoxin Xre/MbcA/ParS toxin-binding domain-containing protein [Massilia sp. LXY-6]|uniref:antitoxin Xre/MbcA/ParS toxin-binding domain-containing protein n=1 Tax=Massilia sp. LXY-6 TaxID=3379823 RepID=UPI003EE2EEB2
MTAIAKRIPEMSKLADVPDAGDKIRWLDFRELYQTTPVDRIDLIRNGVSAADFKTFVSGLDVQQEKVFSMLDIATATVNRKASRNEALSREDSEKVVGMAKLIGQVETMLDESGDPELMKDFDAARWLTHWMEEPIPALGGASPSEYMDTIEGQEMISKLLATMQTGAYA